MRNKFRRLILCLMAAGMLTSCALLPQEEEVRSAPVMQGYTRPEYQTEQVERGDLIHTVKVSCSYVPVQSVSLPFAMDGEYIDRYMVQAGDQVQEGQLLAQLQLGDLETKIASAKNEIAVIRLQMEYHEKRFALEKKRLAVTTAEMDAAEKAQAMEKVQKEYENTFRSLQDSLTLTQLSLDVLEEDVARRQIRAPFSGTITRVAKFEDGDRCQLGIGVITLVDSTRSIFRASTEYWDRFHSGVTYQITARMNTYEAVLATESELGLAVQRREEGKRGYVYLALTQPSFELEEGVSGTVEIVLDERRDVLHVPASAVATAGEQTIVYCLREDGMRTYKPVETGVTINGRTEIVSGLSEGESIVVK